MGGGRLLCRYRGAHFLPGECLDLANALGGYAVFGGQFDDLEGPAERILMDDDDPLLPTRRLSSKDEYPDGHKYPKGHK